MNNLISSVCELGRNVSLLCSQRALGKIIYNIYDVNTALSVVSEQFTEMKSWIFFAFMFVGWILAAIFAFTSMREVAIICLNQRANQKQRLQKVGFKKVLREVTVLAKNPEHLEKTSSFFLFFHFYCFFLVSNCIYG
ncbi:hypothetical protein M3Y98_00870000 [Aphelenchoides besseyi]|nr:hypothetical protein M3Y98_00870000 [Aphelenchoides besseyi]